MKKEKKAIQPVAKKRSKGKDSLERRKSKDKKSLELRVLILEDNPVDAELMERQLKKDGITIVSRRVESKSSYLKALKTFQPELLLADYKLPKFDALRALALGNKMAPQTPFIIVTGTISEETAVTCMKQGADDYLLKDRLARLGEAVRQARETRRLQAEKTVLEVSLRAAAENWRSTFDSMSNAVCLLDGQGAVQKCNRAMNRLLGLPFNRIIGRNCLDLICGKEKRRSCAFTRMLKTRRRMEEETLWRGRWYQVTVDPVSDPVGTSAGAVHIMTDISERKKMEATLRESEERFRGLYENTTIGMYRTTPDGRIVLANPALIRMLGHSSFADLAKRDLEKGGFEPAYPRRYFREQLEKNGQVIGLESAWLKKDGTPIYVRESAVIIRAENGDILYYDGTVEDISGRKQAEGALREMNEIFQAFLKHNPIYVFIKDENIRPIYLSENYEKMLGRPLQEILGKNMDELFPSPLSRSMIEDDKGILREGVPREFIEELDGRTYSTLKFPILINGKPKYLAGYTTDITERKRDEDLIHASLREKEILLKEIHHRVKNNLQVISGLLSLQAAQIDDERFQRMIKESQGRIWTMALIHQTLYQSGNLAAIDMADYIRSLVGNLLSSHAQVAMPPTIHFDLLPLRLGIDKAIPLALIINELVTNVMKHAFTDGRPGEIRISLQERRGTARRAPDEETDVQHEKGAVPHTGTARCAPTHELIVADNGVGLPTGYDLKNQKSLGLQLVAMLAKQLEGQFAIESRNGTGVRIMFINDEKNKK